MRWVRPILVQGGAPAIKPASPEASLPDSPPGVSFAAALLQSGLVGTAPGALMCPLTLSQAHEFLHGFGPSEAFLLPSVTVAEHDLGEEHLAGHDRSRRVVQ